MIRASAAIQQYAQDELARAPAIADRVITQVIETLTKPQYDWKAGERQAAEDLARSAAAQRQRMVADYTASLRAQVQAELQGEPPPIAAQPSAASARVGAGPSARSSARLTLELVDERAISSDVETTRATETLRAGAEHELRELATYLSTLAGDAQVVHDHNALRPAAHARALWAAAQWVPEEGNLRSAFMRHAAPALAQWLRQIYAAACTRLEESGVEPAAYRTVILNAGARIERDGPLPSTAPARAADGRSLEQLAASLAAVEQRLQARPVMPAMGALPMGPSWGNGAVAPAGAMHGHPATAWRDGGGHSVFPASALPPGGFAPSALPANAAFAPSRLPSAAVAFGGAPAVAGVMAAASADDAQQVRMRGGSGHLHANAMAAMAGDAAPLMVPVLVPVMVEAAPPAQGAARDAVAASGGPPSTAPASDHAAATGGAPASTAATNSTVNSALPDLPDISDAPAPPAVASSPPADPADAAAAPVAEALSKQRLAARKAAEVPLAEDDVLPGDAPGGQACAQGVSERLDALLQGSLLNDDFKPALERLRAPAVALARHDPRALDAHHPLWAFIARIAWQCKTLPEPPHRERQRTVQVISGLIDQIAKAPAHDAALLRWAQERLAALEANRLQRRIAAHAKQAQALAGVEVQLLDAQALRSAETATMDFAQMSTMPSALFDAPPSAASTTAQHWLDTRCVGDVALLHLQGRWVHAQLLWHGDQRELWLWADCASDAIWPVRRGAMCRLHEEGLARDARQPPMAALLAMAVATRAAPETQTDDGSAVRTTIASGRMAGARTVPQHLAP